MGKTSGNGSGKCGQEKPTDRRRRSLTEPQSGQGDGCVPPTGGRGSWTAGGGGDSHSGAKEAKGTSEPLPGQPPAMPTSPSGSHSALPGCLHGPTSRRPRTRLHIHEVSRGAREEALGQAALPPPAQPTSPSACTRPRTCRVGNLQGPQGDPVRECRAEL